MSLFGAIGLLDHVCEQGKPLSELPQPWRCRQLREHAGLGRHAVAAAVGVRPNTLARHEAGYRSPLLGLNVRYLRLLRFIDDWLIESYSERMSA